jgi:hypothetical protein
VPPETAFFDEIAPALWLRREAALMRVLRRWRRLPELDLSPELIRQRLGTSRWKAAGVLAAILDLYALGKGKARCGEKTPQHLLHVPAILRQFPDANVICMLRDGRDAALSLSDMPWWRHKSLAAAARLWRRYARLIEEFTRKYPGRFMVVRYEDLVARPEEVLSPVMDYLGEAFEPGQILPGVPSNVVLPRSMPWKGKTLEPIDAGSISRRRNEASPAELALLERTLSGDLRRHGYESWL